MKGQTRARRNGPGSRLLSMQRNRPSLAARGGAVPGWGLRHCNCTARTQLRAAALLGGSGCSREGVAAEREGMVRGGRRRRGEQIGDGKGQLQLAKLGEGRRRRRADQEQKSSLLLPMVHHGERAREQGEGSNAVEVWAEAAPATRRGAEQGSSSAGGAEREGSGAQGRRVRLRGRGPGTAGCVGNSERGFSQKCHCDMFFGTEGVFG